MNYAAEGKKEREGTFLGAISVFLACVVVIMIGIVILKMDAHIPIVMATAIAAIYGLRLNISYDEIQKAILKSVSDSLDAILVLLMIGPMIASWVACGTVPYIIHLGLGLLSPSWFLLFVVLMCAVLSSITGSSWTTVGTIGVAFIGIAIGLGVPVSVTAGAIVCGAYFGDKCSPISDVVVFTSGITKVNIYKHAKNVLFTTGPAFLISAAIFAMLGLKYAGLSVDQQAIDAIRDGLAAVYKFSPVLWVPFLVLIISIALKMPAIPSLMLGSVVGTILAVGYQGCDLAAAMGYLYKGYSVDTGMAEINTILNRGGMTSMMYTVGLVLCSMSMAGVFDRTKILLKIVEKLHAITRTRVGLIVATLGTGVLTSYFAADPYIAALVPTKAFEKEYEKQGLDRCVLSRTVSDGGICMAPIVPWGSNGVFCSQTLGISVGTYMPFYFMGVLTPLFTVLTAVSGIGIKYRSGDEAPNQDR